MTISDFHSKLVEAAINNLSYTPMPNQRKLLEELSGFVLSPNANEVFILNGYAGTGKTSIVGAMIRALKNFRRNVVILAPTGRAAKIAGQMAAHKSSTIHKRLFRGNSADPSNNQFFLAQNTDVDTIFFVDEASLISDYHGGSLLQSLVRHVYSAPGCKMVLIGDLAQLPPVGQQESTAMNPERLRQFNLKPYSFTLDIPVRQAAESGILHNATKIRNLLFTDAGLNFFRLDVADYPDVEVISSAELDDYLSSSYAEVGEEETLIITRSNRRANNFNQAVRNLVMGADSPLQSGDRLIISKNDYFWSKQNKLASFIANGDVAIVNWVGKMEKNYGRYFCETELYFPGDDNTISANIMLRSLITEGPSIPAAEMQRFYNVVAASTEGTISERMRHVLDDPYYNALQAKYAYCVTCHKSQGGQWKHIYIDMGTIAPDVTPADFYRWLYTAFTRATEKVFLINAGKFA